MQDKTQMEREAQRVLTRLLPRREKELAYSISLNPNNWTDFTTHLQKLGISPSTRHLNGIHQFQGNNLILEPTGFLFLRCDMMCEIIQQRDQSMNLPGRTPGDQWKYIHN